MDFKDITTQGAFSYRELQNQNNIDTEQPDEYGVFPDGSSLEDEDTQVFATVLQSMVPSGGVSEWERQHEGTFTAPISSKTEWGKSMFDEGTADLYELEHLGDIRAWNQPFYAKIAAGITKGAITVGSTFVSGTAGLVVGIGTAVIDSKWSGLWDNAFTRTMNDLTQAAEEWLPNYYSQEELDRPFYENIFTANFWGDKFIKNLGFTIGAAWGGKLWTLPINAAIKGISKAASAMSKAQKLQKASQVINQELGAPPIYSSITGSITSAIGEGSIEALNNTNDWERLRTAELQDKVRQDLEAIEMEYQMNKGTLEFNPETGEAKDPAYEKYLQDRKNLEDTYNEALKQIQRDKAKMGNRILAANIPILTASNLYMWGRFYAGGYVGNSVAGYIVRNTENMFKVSSKRGAIAAYLGRGAVEGTEEIMQRYAAEVPGLYYGDKLNNFYESHIHPLAEQQAVSWINSVSEGFMKTFINDSLRTGGGWEEFTIGAITGMLGIPKMTTKTDAEGKTHRRWTWGEGVVTEVREYNKKRKRAQEIVDKLNKIVVEKPEYIKQYQKIIAHMMAQDEMNEALKNKKRFDYKNAEHKQLIGDILMMKEAGALDLLEEMIGEAFDYSDANLQEILKATATIQEGKIISIFSDYMSINQDGSISVNLTEENKQKIIEQLEKNKKDVKDTIDQYKKSAKILSRRVGSLVTDEQMEELIWLHMQNKHFFDRLNQIYSDADVKTFLSKIKEVLSDKISEQAELDRFQEELADILLKGQNLTEEERKAAVSQMKGNFSETLKNLQDIVETMSLNSDEAAFKMLAYYRLHPKMYDAILDYFKEYAEEAGMQNVDETLSSIKDITLLADGIQQFQDKLRKYIQSPEAQAAEHRRIKEAWAKVKTKAAKTQLANKLSQAKQGDNIDDILNESELSEEEKQSVLNDAAKNNETVSNYKKKRALRQSITNAINKAKEDKELNDLLEEEEQESALDQIIKDVLELLDRLFKNSTDALQMQNEASVSMLSDIFNEDTENGAKRFDRASKLLNRIIAKIKVAKQQGKTNRNPVTQADIDALNAQAAAADEVANKKEQEDKEKEKTKKDITITGTDTKEQTDTENNGINDKQEDKPQTTSGQRPYIRPAIPELHIEGKKKKDYRPFFTIVQELEPGVDFSAIWNYLNDKRAFEHVNSGKLKAGDKIYFVIDPNYQGLPGSQPIFMAVYDEQDHLQIIGSLDEGASMDRYQGLRELSDKIREEYKKHQEKQNSNSNVISYSYSIDIAEISNTFSEFALYNLFPSLLIDRLGTEEWTEFLENVQNPAFKNDKDKLNLFLAIILNNLRGGTFFSQEQLQDKQLQKNIDLVINGLKNNGCSFKEENEKLIIYKSSPSTETIVSTQPFVSSLNSHVSKIMLGIYGLSDDEVPLSELQKIKEQSGDKTSFVFAIIKNGTWETSSGNIKASDIENVVDQNNKEGRLYILLRNSRGTYTPMAVRIKHFGEGEFDIRDATTKATDVGKKIDDLLNKLSLVHSSEDVINVVTQLNKILYMDDVFIRYQNNKETGGQFLRITRTQRDSSGKFVTETVDGKTIYKEDTIATINILKVNKDTGEIYQYDTNNIKEQLIAALYSMKLPIQVDYSLFSNTTYMKKLIESGVIVSNIKNPQMRSSWFTANPVVEGKEVRAENPNKSPIDPTPPIGNNDHTIQGDEIHIVADITINGVKMKNQTVYLDGNTVRNDKGEIIKVSEQELRLLKVINAANKQVGVQVVTLNNNEYVVSKKNIENNTEEKVFNKTTQQWVTDKEIEKKVLDIYNNRVAPKKTESESNKIVTQIQEDQGKVDRSKTDSENYYILEEDGEYHPYKRVHTVLGDNWEGGQSKQGKRAATVATKVGTMVDSVVREFFNKGSATKPSAMSQDAFNELIAALQQIKDTIDKRGETFYTNNLVIFVKNEDGTREAGELDILSVDKNGEFHIYDIKTSKEPFNNSTTFGQKQGLQKMSTKEYYTKQLQEYAKLFEQKYGKPIKSIAILPFWVRYNVVDRVSGITKENGITLPLANQQVEEQAAQPVAPAPEAPVSTEQSEETHATETTTINRRRRKIGIDRLNRKVDDKHRPVMDIEEEIAWLDRVLPQVRKEDKLRIVEGLINASKQGEEAWGQFMDGIITISDIAAVGTIYHEAFHYVMHSILNESDRVAVLNEAREIWGDLSFEELEERLAEDFREYVMNRHKKKTWGQKIIEFFKSLFNLTNNGYQLSPYLLSFYQRINEGKYAQGQRASIDINSKGFESLKKDVTDLLNKFQIQIHEIDDYDSNQPLFDTLERVVNIRDVSEFTGGAAYAIVWMMQHDPSIKNMWLQDDVLISAIAALHLPNNLNKLLVYAGKAYIENVKQNILNNLADQLAQDLKQFYLHKTIHKDSLSLIQRFLHNLTNYDSEFAVSNLALAVKNGDYTIIETSLFKPGKWGTQTEIVDLEKALKDPSNWFERGILELMSKHGIALAGSSSIAIAGRVLRPSENPFHDLDFNAKGKSREEIEKVLQQASLSPIFHRIINNNKERAATISYIVSNKPVVERTNATQRAILRNTTLNRVVENSPVLRTILFPHRTLVDPTTGKAVAIVTNSDIKILDDSFKITILDFFIHQDNNNPSSDFGSTRVTLDGVTLSVSDYRNAMEAKVNWHRNKDVWDYVMLILRESSTGKIPSIRTLRNELTLRAAKENFAKAKVIWASPTIGKTYYTKDHSDEYIDWDEFIGDRIYEFLESKVDPQNIMYTEDGKRTDEFYRQMTAMRTDLENTDYVAFIRQEFDKLIERANKENKKILVSNLIVLNSLADKIDFIIAVPQRTFIERVQERNGWNRRQAQQWKVKLDNIMTKYSRDKIFYTDRYLSDIIQEMKGSTFASLNKETQESLLAQGLTAEEFDALTQEEREEIIRCLGI